MDEPRTYFELFKEDEHRVEFKTGQVIFEAGRHGDEMYVVRAGSVVMRAGDKLLETIGTGGIFGEMALIDDSPRSASVIALSDCELVVIDRKRFEAYLRRVPGFAIEVMRVMADRLRRRTEEAARP
jgi:CRP-like cAMP-binding protein